MHFLSVCHYYQIRLRHNLAVVKYAIWVLSTQPLVSFIYNPPTPVTDILAVQLRGRSRFPDQLRPTVGGTWCTFLMYHDHPMD